MVHFIFVRHGLSICNQERRFAGQLDAPLADEGRRQAEAVSQYIHQNFAVDAICASDLSRTVDTVFPLSKTTGLPIQTYSDLRELYVGEWQGMRIEDIKKEFPERFAEYLTCHELTHAEGRETYVEMSVRALRVMDEIAKEHDGKTVVIATHHGVIRVLLAAWLGIPIKDFDDVPHLPNASVTVVEYEDGKGKPICVGYREYLEEIEKDTTMTV